MSWNIQLHKQLAQAGSGFVLDVAFVSPAKRLALLGPSGAGKTLTLKMMAGVMTPDTGHVTVAGRCLYDSQAGTKLSPQARQLAYMFQDYALFPHLTVRQNIAFSLRAGWFNPRRAAADAAVQHWIEVMQLQAVAGQLPHQISGGQRQRTALARSLVNQPLALLLDEPFAALDQALRHSLRDELRDLQDELKLPMLLITHDDKDVAALADEVVHVRDGRVLTAAEVDETPGT